MKSKLVKACFWLSGKIEENLIAIFMAFIVAMIVLHKYLQLQGVTS